MKKNLDVVVSTFQEKYLSSFRDLNIEWIKRHFKLEPTDLLQLNDPYATILEPGGEIFFVLEGQQVVGTCAVIPHDLGSFEIAKMAVAPTHRGNGLGNVLMEASIQWCKRRDAREILILSNTVLEPAIQLYRKFGFRTTHLGTHPDYNRCNIEMRRSLDVDQEKRTELSE